VLLSKGMLKSFLLCLSEPGTLSPRIPGKVSNNWHGGGEEMEKAKTTVTALDHASKDRII